MRRHPPSDAESPGAGAPEKETGRSMPRPPLVSSLPHAAPASPPFADPGYWYCAVTAVCAMCIFRTDSFDHTAMPEYSAPPPDVRSYACLWCAAAPSARDGGVMRTSPPYGSGCIRRFPATSAGPHDPPPHPTPTDSFPMHWMVARTQHGKNHIRLLGKSNRNRTVVGRPYPGRRGAGG